MKLPTRWMCIALGVVLAMGGVVGCSKARKLERHLARANAHLQAGEYDKAEIEFLNARRYDQSNHVCVEGLATIFQEQGRLLDAARALTIAKQLNPTNLNTRAKLSRALLAGGAIKEAREEARYVLDRSITNEDALLLLVDSSLTTNLLRETKEYVENIRPRVETTPGYYLALGGIQSRQQDLAGAEASIRRALALATNNPRVHFALANLYAAQRKSKEADAEFKRAAELSPLRSPYRVRYAQFKAGEGDPAGARQLLEDLQKQVPDFLPALLRLAELDLIEANYEDCEKLLKRVLTRDPMNLEGLSLNPTLLVAKGEPQKAVAELEKLLQLTPRNPQLHYRIAVAALMNNDQTKAISSLTQTLTLAPDYPEAVLLLAELNLRRGDSREAVSSLTRFVKKYPTFPQAQLLLASAYRAQGDLNNALAVYRNLAQAAPTNPQPVFLVGLIQREQGQDTAARKTFEKALEVSPSFLPALEQLVGMDVQAQKFDAARARMQAEVDKTPKSAERLLLLARVYQAETNLPLAEATFLKAIEASPDFAPAQVQLARFYVAAQREGEALQRFQQIVSKNTNDLVSLMQIGILHSEATNHPAARDAYEQILRMNPRYVPALNNLAWLYSEHLNDQTRAYEYARKASDLQPGNAAAADTLGWVCFKRGEYGRASALLRESARKLPAEAEVQFHLGMTHYMLGEETPARVALQDALQLSRDFPGRDEAVRKLAILQLGPGDITPARVAELEKELQQSPQDPVTLSRLSLAYQRSGNVDKAISAYEAALKQNPDSLAVLVRLAELYATQPGKAGAALELAHTAHKLAPEDAAIARALGVMALKAGDYQWAHSLLEQGVRGQSAGASLLHDLALARYGVGLVDSAAAAMQSALTAQPEPALRQSIEDFLAMNALLKDPAKAEASLARAREIAQRDTNNIAALMVLAVVDARQGRTTEAGAGFERILSFCPTFTPAVRELAILNFGALNNHEKAYDYAMRVREADRSDLAIAKILGVTSYERGDYARAADLLIEYTRSQTGDADGFYQLGLARQKLKQVRECKDALNRALSLSPNAPFAAEAKRILAELK